MSGSRGVVGGALLSCLVVLVFKTYQVSGIECYQCNSGYDPRCGDPFDPYSLASINCSLKIPPDHLSDVPPVLCRKTIQKVYGKIRIVRECGYLTDEERDDKPCVRRSGTHDVFATYCSCTTNLCNSGAYQLPNHIVMVASFIFATGVAYFNLASHLNKRNL